MKLTLFATLLLLTGLGCSPTATDPETTRNLFDAQGKQVISVFANRRDRVLSVLYGNAPAVVASLSGYTQKIPGMELTLVTYNQADNKYWYGSYINGRIRSVETISLPLQPGTDSIFVYKTNKGNPPKDASGNRISATARVKQILAHKAVVFP